MWCFFIPDCTPVLIPTLAHAQAWRLCGSQCSFGVFNEKRKARRAMLQFRLDRQIESFWKIESSGDRIMRATPTELPQTLGALRKSTFSEERVANRGVKDELRDNLIC